LSLKFDFDLTAAEKEQMARISDKFWFTQVAWRNAASPEHPESKHLGANHEFKRATVLPWIRESVKGKRVLDLFCANGAFSFEAALAGAKEVVGVEFSPERVACAQFVASTFKGKTDCAIPRFLCGNAYELPRYFSEPFDIVMAFGGLYHIADPPYILTQLRALTKERLIVQTSSILNKRGNYAKFVIRKDQTKRGLTSVVGGRGVWFFSPTCFENMLQHAGFKIVESHRPSWLKRKQFPWYSAVAEPC